MIGYDFVTGGNAVFTIKPTAEFVAASGGKDYYTYKVVRKSGYDGRDVYFVSLLIGPDNTADFGYLGLLNAETGQFRTTGKSCCKPGSTPARVIARVLAALHSGRQDAITAAGWGINHEGRCCRCNRTLTTPESVAAGYGPECRRKMAG